MTNAKYLIKHIQEPHPDFTVAMQTRIPGDNPDIYHKYQAEIYRLLMNYSASTSALIDHTRILEQKLEKTNHDTHKSFLDRRREMTGSGVAHFVKNLRNFVLHRDLPSTGGVTSWKQGDTRIRFDTSLSSESLLEWDGWSRTSKDFLAENEHVSMSEVILEYDRMVQELYTWIFEYVYQVTLENSHRKVNLDISITNPELKLRDLEAKHV